MVGYSFVNWWIIIKVLIDRKHVCMFKRLVSKYFGIEMLLSITNLECIASLWKYNGVVCSITSFNSHAVDSVCLSKLLLQNSKHAIRPNSNAVLNLNQPSSHVGPLLGIEQAHLNLFIWSVQVPPLLHGIASHSLISVQIFRVFQWHSQTRCEVMRNKRGCVTDLHTSGVF